MSIMFKRESARARESEREREREFIRKYSRKLRESRVY
jgi:hypothetical protein